MRTDRVFDLRAGSSYYHSTCRLFGSSYESPTLSTTNVKTTNTQTIALTIPSANANWGLGSTIAVIPRKTGNFLINYSALIASSVTSDGYTAYCYYGTGTAPVNGAAVTGTRVGRTPLENDKVSGGGLAVSHGASGMMIGLTIGTQYWLDMSLLASTGGTATMYDVVITLLEV